MTARDEWTSVRQIRPTHQCQRPNLGQRLLYRRLYLQFVTLGGPKEPLMRWDKTGLPLDDIRGCSNAPVARNPRKPVAPLAVGVVLNSLIVSP